MRRPWNLEFGIWNAQRKRMTAPTLTSASSVGPAALALLLLVAPLLVGIPLGRALRQRNRGAFLGVVVALLLTLAAVEGLQQVGTWDSISIGLLFVTGVLLGCSGIDRRSAMILVVSSVLALAGLEAALRWWLPPPPRFPTPDKAALVLEPAAWDAGCSVLYEAADVDQDVHVLRRIPSRPKLREHAPLVVHLGDSMTYGEGVAEEETFPALLDARQPTVIHRNYGVWAVGTDFEYLLLQRILEVHSPTMVVLHVYLGNDIYDIDRPYACCDAGPLLDYSEGEPIARCVSARWRFPLTLRLGRSPPPYPLRVATSWSYAAGYGATAFSRLASAFESGAGFIRTEGEATESDWEHFREILTKVLDELPPNVELIVNLLPTRQALETADPTASAAYRAGQRAATVTKQLGIRTLDAWDVLADAVKRDGSPRYFREHDIHFTPEGHQLLANWLETQLSSPMRSPTQ
jgi:lysophospholipase L1-like esterase